MAKNEKDSAPIPKASCTGNNMELIKKLLDCRKRIFKKNKTLKEEILSGIEAIPAKRQIYKRG